MSTSSVPASRTASMRAHELAKWAILSGVYLAGAVITEAALAHDRASFCSDFNDHVQWSIALARESR